MRKPLRSVQHKVFCQLLSDARIKAGLTQHELARRLSRPQSFVAKIEAGERRVDTIELIAISRAIGIDPCRIIKKLAESF
jgi:transcriptional regulator with XRE-family HTH domain